MWLLLVTGAVGITVFVERLLHYHREQINSIEFINGVRNVLRRDNVVEALSICEATPGPVARLVKTAILSRDRGRDGVREALEDSGLLEVPRLEERLNLLATIAQIAPVMGLLGTVLGFISVFQVLQQHGVSAPARRTGGRRVEGAGLHRGGTGHFHSRLRRLQLPGQPREQHRARHGEGLRGNPQPPGRTAEIAREICPQCQTVHRPV